MGLAGGVAFYIFSQPPQEALSDEFKEEAVTKLLGRKAQLEADNVPTGDTQYKGKYISFKYPARALEYTFRENSTSSESASLEDFSFDLSDPKAVFNMKVVANSRLTDIADYPAVRLREQRGYEYEKSSVMAGSTQGLVFFKKGMSAEKSGFFLKDGRIYTISVTGPNEESVGELFDSILKTVSFSG